MKKETKLAVLKELIANSHDLCYSVYTPDLKLVSSSWDAERMEGMDLLLAGVGEEMLAYSKDGHYPFLLDSFLNITWIADFEWKEDKLYRIHILGPTLNNQNSYEDLRDKGQDARDAAPNTVVDQTLRPDGGARAFQPGSDQPAELIGDKAHQIE